MLYNLQQISDSSVVWTYPFAQILGTKAQQQLHAGLSAFLTTWCTHGTPLHAAVVVEAWAIMVLVDEQQQAVSGCAKDALHRCIGELAAAVSCEPFAHTHIACVASKKVAIYSQQAAVRVLN